MRRHWDRQRLIVVPLVSNQSGELLLCKMPADRGVFPGKWSLPGGGVEDGELIEEALRREVREELGIEIDQIESLFFRDLLHTKVRDGASELIYMVFLVFACRAVGTEIDLSEEFDEYAWVASGQLAEYGLDEFTMATLARGGIGVEE